MGMGGPPKFKIGDRVVDFRGFKATVVSVRDSGHPGKSNRVEVLFDGDARPKGIEFYESVFEKIEEEDKILDVNQVISVENDEQRNKRLSH